MSLKWGSPNQFGDGGSLIVSPFFFSFIGSVRQIAQIFFCSAVNVRQVLAYNFCWVCQFGGGSFGYNDSAHFLRQNNSRSYYFNKVKGIWTVSRKHSKMREN